MASVAFDQIVADSAEHESIAELLMPVVPDRESGTLRRVDGSVMSIFEVEPWPGYDKNKNLHAMYSDKIARVLSRFGECDDPLVGQPILSTTIYASKRVEDYIQFYKSEGGSDIEIVKLLEEGRIRYVMDHLHRPIIEEDGWIYAPRLYRSIISVIVPPAKALADEGGAKAAIEKFARGALASIGMKLKERTDDEMAAPLTREAKRLAGFLAGVIKGEGVRWRTLDDGDWKRVVRDLLWSKSGWKYQVNHQPGVPLYAQAPIGEVVIDPRNGGIASDDTNFRTVTIESIPTPHYPGYLTMPAEGLRGDRLLDYIENGWITLSAQAQPARATRGRSTTRQRWAFVGACLPGLRSTHLRDCALVNQHIDQEKRKYFWTHVTVTVGAAGWEQAQRRAEDIASHLSAIGCEAKVNKGRAGTSYTLQSIPGNAFPPILGACRDMLIPDRAVADFMPLLGASRGAGSPTMLLFNRYAELMLVGPFNDPRSNRRVASWHGLISAGTGKGKSMFATFFRTSCLRHPLFRGVVLDNGYSFRPLAKVLGPAARHIEIYGQRQCINPFYGDAKTGGIFGEHVLLHLAYGDGTKPSRPAIGILNSVIQECFKAKLSKDIKYRNLAEVLEKHRGWILSRHGKRLRVRTLSDVARLAIIDRGHDEDAGYVVYDRYRLITVRSVEGQSQSPKRPVPSKQKLDAWHKAWLTNQGFLYDDEADGCFIYHDIRHKDPTSTLQREGFEAVLVTDYSVVDVEDEDDVAILEGMGIKFILPNGETERRRQEFRAMVMAKHPDASPEAIESKTESLVNGISGQEVYDAAEGTADMQDEVLFREVGARLEQIKKAKGAEAEIAADLLNRLRPYFGAEGQYSSFFDGPNTISLGEVPFTVIEVQELVNKLPEHVAAAVISAVVNMGTRWMTDPRNRKFRKFIDYEEGWAYTEKYPVAAEAILASFRTGRKHAGGVWFITQDLVPMASSPVGEAIIKLARNRIFLEQSPEAVEAVSKLLRYTPEKTKLMASVQTQPGSFAEVFFDMPEIGLCDVGVLINDRTSYWLNTTQPDEVDKRTQLTSDIMLEEKVPESVALVRAIARLVEDERNRMSI